MKKLLALLLAAVMLFSLAACKKEPADPNHYKLGDYELDYKGACIMEDVDGNDAVVITLDFTNNGEENVSFFWGLYCEAFQDDEELEAASVFTDYENWEMVTDNQEEEVKPGRTSEVCLAYVLDDSKEDVVLKIETMDLVVKKDDKAEIVIELRDLDREESDVPATDPELTEPEFTEPEETTGDELLDFWNGEWYGWWAMVGTCTGDYEELDGVWWDACAEIEIGGDYTGTFKFWDEDFSRDDYISITEISLSSAGTGPHGTVMSEGGDFWDGSIDHADWIVDPELSGYENMIWIDGTYEGEEGGFDYMIYLKPWGELWDDVETAAPDDLPYRYSDWYLPLIEAGKSMPDVIGDEIDLSSTPTGGPSGDTGDLVPIGYEEALGVKVPDGFTYNDGWSCYSNGSGDDAVSLWLADATCYDDQGWFEDCLADETKTDTLTLGGRTVYVTENPENFYGATTEYYVVLDDVADFYGCSIQVSSSEGDMAATQTPDIQDMIASIAVIG